MSQADKDQLLRAVADAPRDGAPKMVLADWYDENGFPILAAIWRWLGVTGRHPSSDRTWSCQGDGYVQPFDLPRRLFIAYIRGRDYDDRPTNIEETVAALAPAWHKLITGGWLRPPWVPDQTTIDQLNSPEARLLKLTKGLR